jgi:foldase protein PrsA
MPSSATTPSRFASVVGLAATAAVVAAGCGNSVPSNSVAKVGDSTITKKEFDHWLKNAAMGQQQGGQAAVPDPPNFERCVGGLKKAPQPKGVPKQSDASLKKQCKQQYDQLKGEVMQFLIQAEWVQQEAEARDVKVSDAEVRKSFEDQKKQAFPKQADYQRFLKSSGMTEQDILFRVKLDTLQTKLTQKVTEDKTKVSEADVREYYEKNKRRFAQPERRDLNVVLTKTRGKADQAKQQLSGGQSFKEVAKDFSIDQASKSQGGKLSDFARGQQDKALDKAVFAAKRGVLTGPVKTQFGYYVFEVAKIKKASQQSYGQAKETIRNLLRSQRESKALNAFIKDFREKYKDQTNCADDFRVAECKNGPKEKTQTGPASGGTPGAPQGTPQGAPQGTPQQAPQGPTPQAPADE